MPYDSSTTAAAAIAQNPLTRSFVMRVRLACAAAIVAAGLVYVNALGNPFVYDDYLSVVENTSIRAPFNPIAIVMHSVTRPVVNFSYAMDRAIWGSGPFGFHLTNVLLHMLNVGLFFVLAWQLSEDLEARTGVSRRPLETTFGAAMLFAVHPMLTEAVGYVSGRSEVLCATFFLGGILCVRQWMLGEGSRWYLAAIFLWIASLATKEIAVMFPFVAIGYGRFVRGGTAREKRRRFRWLHLPLLAITIVAAAARLAVFALVEHPGEVTIHWPYTLVEMDVVRRYIGMLLMPTGQSVFHDVPAIASLFDRYGIAAIAVMVVMVAGAWQMRRVNGIVSLGVFWFLLLLVPSSALILLDRGEPMAEHRVYVASCGLFLVVGTLIGWLAGFVEQAAAQTRVLIRGAALVTVALLCGGTIIRNAVWSDPVLLWLEAVEASPHQWRPWLMFGEALQNAGRRAEAVEAYKTGLALRPEEQWGYMKLAMCQAELGRLDDASATFEQLRRRDPHSEVALAGLGAVSMLAGHPDQARRYFVQTISEHPRNIAARQSLAVLEENVANNPVEALHRCEEIQQLAPATPGNDECIRRIRSRLAGAGTPAR